jgi:hypothetical protein
MHQTHGNAADAPGVHLAQLLMDALLVGPREDAHRLARQAHDEPLVGGVVLVDDDAPARGVLGIVLERDALVHLDDGLVQHARPADVEVKDARPALVANLEAVPKAARDDERHGLALALEEGVGRDGGAHPDRLNGGRVEESGRVGRRRRGVARLGEDAPDALERRVGIVGRVLGQQLDDDGPARGQEADAVGKGAAAVDGDADARHWGCVSCWCEYDE